MSLFATLQNRRSRRGLAGLVLAAFFLMSSVPARAGAPTEQIQSAIEQALAILKNPKLQNEAKRQELRKALYHEFDFAEMARRSLGSHWARRSAQERQEFVKLFTELVENSYMSNIESYSGEKLIVGAERRDGEYAEVDTKIVSKKGEEISVVYKLRQNGGKWKIYDVMIENISLVNNYRSQFDRVIARSSFDDLVRRMKDKQFDSAGRKSTT